MKRFVDYAFAEITSRAIERITDDSLGAAIRLAISNCKRAVKIQNDEGYEVIVVVMKFEETEG